MQNISEIVAKGMVPYAAISLMMKVFIREYKAMYKATFLKGSKFTRGDYLFQLTEAGVLD